MLIAGVFKVVGVHVLVPMTLCVICSVLTIGLISFIARREGISAFFTLVILLTAMFVPLIPLTIMGMEHCMQILADLAFLYAASRAAAKNVVSIRHTLILLLLAAAVTGARYEGLFLVGLIGLALLSRGKWSLAIGIGLAAATPIAIFGWISIHHGGMWLANSVILKGKAPQADTAFGFVQSLFDAFVDTILRAPETVRFVLAGVTLLALRQSTPRPASAAPIPSAPCWLFPSEQPSFISPSRASDRSTAMMLTLSRCSDCQSPWRWGNLMSDNGYP